MFEYRSRVKSERPYFDRSLMVRSLNTETVCTGKTVPDMNLMGRASYLDKTKRKGISV
jgi:hypothetical protein